MSKGLNGYHFVIWMNYWRDTHPGGHYTRRMCTLLVIPKWKSNIHGSFHFPYQWTKTMERSATVALSRTHSRHSLSGSNTPKVT